MQPTHSTLLNKIIWIPVLLLVVLSCNATKQKKSTANIDESIVTLYKATCSGCHGQQLQQFKMLKSNKKSVEELANTIKNGNLDAGMVAFGEILNDKQIQELAQFIKSYDYDQNFVVEQKEVKDYNIEVVIDGLEVPWGMEFLPNGDMLVAEREGVLSRFSKTDGLHPIKGLPPIRAKGQGGLMDLKLHPQYEENGWLYISYSYIDETNSRAGNTAIIRAKLINDELTQIEPIYKGTPATTTNHHFGNRMVFDQAGYLYFSNGERGARDVFPQKLDNTNGKIHRLNDDGSIPKDNPFVGQENAIPSIYSYGHRNPQGLVLHPVTGEIWEHEHGPRGGDEINLIKPGSNYGWPVITYGINYIGTVITDLKEKEGMEQPLHYYLPSIAPCGMAFLDSDIYPAWKNNLFIGSLRFQYLERVVLSGTTVIYQEKMLEELSSRVRDVRVGPDGYLYVAVEGPGRILKILPNN